jgi:hypothetical protein
MVRGDVFLYEFAIVFGLIIVFGAYKSNIRQKQEKDTTKKISTKVPRI